MKEVAEGVWLLDGVPQDLLNVYLIDGVLIDSGLRFDEGRILRQLKGRTVTAHALTHAHPDHLGSSHAICEKLDIPFWVGAEDVPAAEDPDELARRTFVYPVIGPLTRLPIARTITRLMTEVPAGPGHPVDRPLTEGDTVGGFTVLDVPGHSAGHVAFWRASDRVLIAGDVAWNFRFLAGRPGLTEPPAAVSPDPARNRDSARRLAALEPEVVCFGHGPPLRDTQAFLDFVERLPAD